jgi:hypothetical protein
VEARTHYKKRGEFRKALRVGKIIFKIMEIKVVPFVPQVTDVNPAGAAASELQTIINQMQAQGNIL